MNNNYLKRAIESVKRAREKKQKNNKKEKTATKPLATIKFPYLPVLGEKIKRLANKANLRVVFSPRETIRSTLVNFKPKSKPIKKDVIYKIPCECSKSYIGETGRTLEIRLKEHQTSIKKRDPDISKLCEHFYKTGHRLLWDEAKVIGHETHWRARKIHETAEIMKGGKMVFSTPSIEIDPVWRPLIKTLDLSKKKRKKNDEPVIKLRRSRRIAAKHQQTTVDNSSVSRTERESAYVARTKR